jgi:predicted nucleotidyltransferase
MFSYIDTIQNLSIREKRALVKSIKEMIKEHIAANREANFQRKQNSALARAEKKAARIAALEAKLEALRNPVGAKAIKANRKPSKVTVTTA